MFEERRINFGRAGRWAAVVALSTLGIGGIRSCMQSAVQDTKDGYQNGLSALLDIARTSYPELEQEIAKLPKPASARDALQRADKALACYGQLLTVRHPFEHPPLINSVDTASCNGDSGLQEEQVKELPEYQKTYKLCHGLREALSRELLLCRISLQEASRDEAFSRDPQISQCLGSLIPRLEILTRRLKEGRLMVSGNILGWTNKFGSFQQMIGQADHYEEARAEINTLLGYLK